MGNKVWLITGGSQGLGLCLAKQLLDSGHKVVATTRTMSKLIAALGEETETFLPVEMNLSHEQSILRGKERIIEKFGTVDVIVNNAGYATRGMLEEVSDQEARRNFDANVFSVLNIIRGFAEILREKRSGYIINISSIAGYSAGMWSGIYGATKFAVEGITEALSQELAPFGVKVISVKPGDMRTTFHDPRTMIIAEKEIADFDKMREQVAKKIKGKNGNQISSPEKAAARIIDITKCDNPPLNLFLGSDSFQVAEEKTNFVKEELSEWREVSLSIAYQ